MVNEPPNELDPHSYLLSNNKTYTKYNLLYIRIIILMDLTNNEFDNE
jgi:hypothetical protein